MSNTNTSRQSPLAKARGLGASGTGTEHWWMQRVTAVANIVLSIALLWVMASIAGDPYEQVKACLAGFLPTLILTLFVAVTFFHAALGLQVVIEDYVHNRVVSIGLLLLVRFGLLVLAFSAILMVLRNFFGA